VGLAVFQTFPLRRGKPGARASLLTFFLQVHDNRACRFRQDAPMTIRSIPRVLFWLLLVGASALLAWNSRHFLWAPSRAPFVIERVRDVPGWWTPLLTAHVVAGLLVLATGPLLFLPAPGPWHRILGTAYAGAAMLVLLPSGLVLSFHAHGGGFGQLGFFLTGLWMSAATMIGLLRLRQHRFPSHRAWMLRSYAMATSALTFRAVYILGYLLGTSYALNYPASTWISTVLNLLVAEALLSRRFHPQPKDLRHEDPSLAAPAPLAPLRPAG